MSETAPALTLEANENVELFDNVHELPPRDEAIETIRNEITMIEGELVAAEEKAERPGVRASANDLVAAKYGFRDLKAEKEPRLDAVRDIWMQNGGEAIDTAEAQVAALNFKSDAQDRIKAQTALRDAKNTFYSNLQESYREDEVSKESVGEEKVADMEAVVSLISGLRNEGSSSELSERVIGRFDKELQTLLEEYKKSPSYDADLAAKIKQTVDSSSKTRERIEDEPPIIKELGQREKITDEPPKIVPLETLENGAAESGDEERDGAWRKTPIGQFAATFLGLKDKLAKSRAGAWAKDRLKGPENKRNRVVATTLGAFALVGGIIAIKYGFSGSNVVAGGLDSAHSNSLPSTAEYGPTTFDMPELPSGTTTTSVEFSDAARNISAGEGWQETMLAAGLPKDQVASRLQEVGPKLVEKGVAYWDTIHSEYRINAPGRLSQDVLELIKNGR